MKKFTKTIVKEFKNCFGRFIAIMAIIALGVGFLIGITQATPDMKNSMNKYYAQSAAYDVSIKSVYGFTEEDVLAIKALKDEAGQTLAERAFAYISTDAPVTVTGGTATEISLIARINGVDFDLLGGDEGVNTLTLVDGNFPQSDNEVVVQRSTHYFSNIKIGDKITISGAGTLDIEAFNSSSVYTQTEFTVVGIVSSPEYYFLDAREVTTLGTGVLGTVIYTRSSVYDLSNNAVFGANGSDAVYTDVSIILKGSDAHKVFYSDYENYVKERLDAFKKLGAERCALLNEKLEGLAAFVPDLNKAEWYVLDIVSTNLSYIGFGMNADKVADVAGIFPIFFILVAALVALTSMTRMVEEDRLQIGTFKALGYHSGRIMSKYMIYCCIASLVGCVAGVLLGFSLLPTIFWEAYKVLYYLPKLSLAFSPWFAVATLAVALGGTFLVTWIAARSSLREKPSRLMQPKAPKAGKRILLERVGFIWNHLKFKYKATIRNIFRYKRNMFMTIISVMGCTALILVGFGLNDSLTAAIDTQFKDILLYDVKIEYSEIAEDGALNDFLRSENCDDYYSIYSEDGHVEVTSGKKNYTESLEMFAVKAEDTKISSFVTLRNRKNSAIIDMSEKGVAISGNVANEYGLSAGDTVVYRRSDGSEATLTLTAVAENYMGNYLYIDAAYFSELFGAVEDNTLLVKTGIDSGDYDALAESLLSDGGVGGISFTSDSKKIYDGLEQTMGFVIAVLVISAGALAAIVLYNLTNINIDERRREIATLRVLGYRRREVAGYIYRESTVLTLVGALLGLGLGVLLHMFLVTRISGTAMLFASAIKVGSYFYSFGLTVIFAAIVYAFMLIKPDSFLNQKN